MKAKKIYKNASSKILSFWLIIILFLIAFVISIGVLAFYSSDIDVRQLEANSMNDKIIMSLSTGGYINNEVFNKDSKITQIVEISDFVIRDSKDFYFNVTIYNSNYRELRSFVLGNPDFEFQCRLKGKKYAKCRDSEFILLNRTNPEEKFIIKVLTGSNQKGV
ncbi:MAG: hypothetical protein QXW97_01895 [Candidatus Pacearchaeota archaeon]